MKAGFVSIFGRPNAGKSTLLNALMGEKLAIVSPKVQTTRHRIKGILTEPDYQVIFSFANSVTFGGAALSAGTGSVSSASGNGTATVTVNLTGVTNAQRLTVTLQGVNAVGDVSVSMGVLIGDASGDGVVNGGDAIQTRSRSGQGANTTNFRSDANTDGFVNGGDTIAVRSRSGTFLP